MLLIKYIRLSAAMNGVSAGKYLNFVKNYHYFLNLQHDFTRDRKKFRFIKIVKSLHNRFN